MSNSYDPLHSPDRAVGFVAPLAVEVECARSLLAETASANIHDNESMLKAAVALDCRLRSLLAALDAERGGKR
ncbi:hypothetical protein [Streptomyces sp. NPDC050564]|uniref:hypothetical protein n=1 Tax=Streptomyces sp. NPDC050564 TaxID=3365631 RepID=UPI003787A565